MSLLSKYLLYEISCIYIFIQYTPLRQDGPTDDARVSLLRQDSPDPETREPVAPPWAGRVEGLNYQISR